MPSTYLAISCTYQRTLFLCYQINKKYIQGIDASAVFPHLHRLAQTAAALAIKERVLRNRKITHIFFPSPPCQISIRFTSLPNTPITFGKNLVEPTNRYPRSADILCRVNLGQPENWILPVWGSGEPSVIGEKLIGNNSFVRQRLPRLNLAGCYSICCSGVSAGNN